MSPTQQAAQQAPGDLPCESSAPERAWSPMHVKPANPSPAQIRQPRKGSCRGEAQCECANSMSVVFGVGLWGSITSILSTSASMQRVGIR